MDKGPLLLTTGTSSNQYPVWTRGTLVRDFHIPGCKSTKLVIKPGGVPTVKIQAIKESILKRKIQKLKEEQQELASNTEDNDSDSEKDKYDEKIAELDKKLESLQKEKHKLFLVLRQVLQKEKKRQQALALSKSQQEAAKYV
jgi:organic radical activating enzyme